MSISYQFMAEGVVRRPSLRVMPSAAHKSVDKSSSQIGSSEKSRDVRRFLKASLNDIDIIKGGGNCRIGG